MIVRFEMRMIMQVVKEVKAGVTPTKSRGRITVSPRQGRATDYSLNLTPFTSVYNL